MSKPLLSIIVAMTEERVIGRDNRLPWHLPEDLARFKSLTMGHSIVMGRKTYESIGKPLPGRTNIVLTRNREFKAEGIVAVASLSEGLKVAESKPGKDEVFVIGGAELFKDAIPLADRIYLTLIHEQIPGDTYLPPIDFESEFTVIDRSEQQGQKSDRFRFSFLEAHRR